MYPQDGFAFVAWFVPSVVPSVKQRRRFVTGARETAVANNYRPELRLVAAMVDWSTVV
jgi:hypothetical protein